MCRNVGELQQARLPGAEVVVSKADTELQQAVG